MKIPTFVKEQALKLLSALVVGVAGLLGIWLTPLKDITIQWIYPERASVTVLVDEEPTFAGQPVHVHVKVAQLATAQVSKGVLRVAFDPDALALSPESPRFVNTPEISGTIVVDPQFVFFTSDRWSGQTTVKATLETKFNTYHSQPVSVRVVSRKYVSAPYLERQGSQAINLSGQWHIELGSSHGEMEIRQDSKNIISGSYRLSADKSAQQQLHIEGYKDGTSFKVFLFSDVAGNSRWRVDSNFGLNQNDKRFVEIKGCGFQIEKDPSVLDDSAVEEGKQLSCIGPRNYVGWRGLRTSTFYASAQLQQ